MMHLERRQVIEHIRVIIERIGVIIEGRGVINKHCEIGMCLSSDENRERSSSAPFVGKSGR